MPPPPPDCPSNVVVLPFEGGNDLISQADEKKLQAAVSEARMCSLSGVIVFDLAAESPSENRLRFTAESVRASAVRQRLRELGVPEEALAVGETGNAGASNNAMSQRFQSQSRVEVQFLFGRLHASWKTAAARAAAAGGPINARRFQDCYECPEMVAIPKGEVTIGEGGAAKRFSIEAMAVSRLEITSREFRAIRPEQWEECSTPDAISGEWRAFIDQVGWYRSEPAVCVNFADAEAYVSALNAKVAGAPYRLLTEAEWEYAARAGANTAFWWGDRAEDACKHANSADASAVNLVTISSCDDGQPGLSEGGKFGENAFGLADMAGNVWEWTRDCFGTEPIAPQTGNDTTSASQCGTRVVRGGSWTSMPEFLRSSSRFGAHANGRFTNQGFRIARRIDAE
jgi:formylglycine-generating enzyme required for sulfatase activity